MIVGLLTYIDLGISLGVKCIVWWLRNYLANMEICGYINQVEMNWPLIIPQLINTHNIPGSDCCDPTGSLVSTFT